LSAPGRGLLGTTAEWFGQTKVIGSELNGEVEAAGVSSATQKPSTLTVCRQTVNVVGEAPEKPASRTCAAAVSPEFCDGPEADFGTTAGSHIYG